MKYCIALLLALPVLIACQPMNQDPYQEGVYRSTRHSHGEQRRAYSERTLGNSYHQHGDPQEEQVVVVPSSVQRGVNSNIHGHY